MSYRALKRQFRPDDDYLEDLQDELLYAKRLWDVAENFPCKHGWVMPLLLSIRMPGNVVPLLECRTGKMRLHFLSIERRSSVSRQ
jgi:hypothetical protein